jgi:hypothetical protein
MYKVCTNDFGKVQAMTIGSTCSFFKKYKTSILESTNSDDERYTR